jgi:pyridoxamine 5'-phosphate oxidase
MNSINKKLSELRTEYRSDDSVTGAFPANPFEQFEKWMDEAINSGTQIPNAIHLSTTGKDGRPSGRIVLLNGFDDRGFIFYTNYESRKGNDLENCRFAAITFFWNELYRQVRIEGEAFRLPESESDEYFRTRPRESQISALASEQSRILISREILEKRVLELGEKYKDLPVPRPSCWGGYYLSPNRIEFWQGRVHRLHDRIRYRLENNSWTIERLYP